MIASLEKGGARQVQFDDSAGGPPSPDLRAPSDGLSALVQRLRQGEEAALQELMELTCRMGFKLAHSLLQDRQLAEDALQEAYFTCYQKIHQLKDPQAFRSWFCRILTHCCHALRQRRPDQLPDDNPPLQPDPINPIIDRLELKQAFLKLQPAEREVLALREVLHLSYEEIAATLSLPLSTIKKRLFTVRQRVIQLLKGPRT